MEKNNGTPLISVIIPVYNVEKYIDKCIKSVIKQTYKEIEIILVDDGSTDKSASICELYSKQDERIKVIHKSNGGLSDARNKGLDCCKGEYITFIDSDDYVDIDYVEYLYDLLKSTDSDISQCGLFKIFDDTENIAKRIKEKKEIISREKAIELYLYQKRIAASACGKMYDAKIFNDIRYPVGYYYEDMAVICDILSKTTHIVVSNIQKYYYVQRRNSIMNNSYSFKKMQRMEIAGNIKEMIGNTYPNLEQAADCRCFLAAVQTYKDLPNSVDRNIRNSIWKKIICYRKTVMVSNKCRKYLLFISLYTIFGEKVFWITKIIFLHVYKKIYRING